MFFWNLKKNLKKIFLDHKNQMEVRPTNQQTDRRLKISCNDFSAFPGGVWSHLPYALVGACIRASLIRLTRMQWVPGKRSEKKGCMMRLVSWLTRRARGVPARLTPATLPAKLSRTSQTLLRFLASTQSWFTESTSCWSPSTRTFCWTWILSANTDDKQPSLGSTSTLISVCQYLCTSFSFSVGRLFPTPRYQTASSWSSLESANKTLKADRLHHACRNSRLNTIKDQFDRYS